MKKGLILVNAYSVLESHFFQAKRLKEEFTLLDVSIDILRNDFFPTRIESSSIATSIEGYDFCVYLDKDKYISEMLELSGLRLFNSHQAILDCDDKMSTYIKLSNSGVKLIDTLPGLLCYDKDAQIEKKTLDKIEKTFGYPVIVKENFGSLGREVYLCYNRFELEERMEHLKNRPHIIQKFINSSYGKDIRIIVIGGKFCAAMQRTSENDFRSNVNSEGKGKGQPIEAPANFIDTAIKCAKVLNLDYCGVDILFGDEEEPIVCEVNSNAFFKVMEKVTGINVARKYAEYIYAMIY